MSAGGARLRVARNAQNNKHSVIVLRARLFLIWFMNVDARRDARMAALLAFASRAYYHRILSPALVGMNGVPALA